MRSDVLARSAVGRLRLSGRCRAALICRARWHWIAPMLPAIALAEQPPSSSETSSLDRVVVTATQTERSLADVPASVTVISRDEIAATPGQSVDDVLRVAGVEMSLIPSYQSHPTSSLISMRGVKSGVTSHALVMIDGVPINDGFSGFVQWNRVPLEYVERIEIVRGGGASLWGTYALGGVINIMTRAPGKSALDVEAGYGTFNTYRAYGYGALAEGDSAKVSLSVGRWSTDGFNQVAPQWRNASTIWDKTSFTADNVQLGGYFTPSSTLTVQARSSLGVQGDPTFFESNGWGVHQDAHFTVGASLFLQGVNLFDRNYIADNSGYFAPLCGAPRSVVRRGADAFCVTTCKASVSR